MSSLARSRVHTLFDDRASRWRASRANRARWAALRWALLLGAVVVVAAFQTGCAATSDARLAEYDYESPTARNVGAPGRSNAERLAASARQGSGGASSIEPPTPSSVKFDIPDEPAVPQDQVTPETQRLADQSQRDVDLILASRRNGVVVPADHNELADGTVAPDSGASAIGSSVAAPRRVIEWNESTRPTSAPPTPHVSQSSNAIATATPTPAEPASQPSDAAPIDNTATSVDIEALRPDRIKQLIVDLSRELYAEGAYSAHPMRQLAVIAAMGMHEDDRKLDPAAIPDLTDEERQLLASLQVFFASVGETLESGEDVHAGVALAAGTLRQSLVHEPQLKLPTVALCTRVGGFGDYSPFVKNTFLAGNEQKAIVYLEIQDFVSDINLNDEFVTELSQQLTIYSDRDGIPVWKEDWLSATDVTRNKRQDFFTTQIITLPKALGVGKYTLKIRVRDEKSKAESETSIAFELVADAKLIE